MAECLEGGGYIEVMTGTTVKLVRCSWRRQGRVKESGLRMVFDRQVSAKLHAATILRRRLHRLPLHHLLLPLPPPPPPPPCLSSSYSFPKSAEPAS